MTLTDYQQLAARTASGGHRRERAILGLCGETGEVAEVRKKYLRGDYDDGEFHRRLIGELGDVLWYLAECCTAHGIGLEVVAEQNIAQLEDRAARGVIGGEGDDR